VYKIENINFCTSGIDRLHVVEKTGLPHPPPPNMYFQLPAGFSGQFSGNSAVKRKITFMAKTDHFKNVYRTHKKLIKVITN
jgi:hypothetical protein